ncbi:MAG: nuclear transport factor 2 family protein [Planctomycetes bacterium]|nr:nuclear transport factor 2 family protein [Planctomycetota bacterium]
MRMLAPSILVAFLAACSGGAEPAKQTPAHAEQHVTEAIMGMYQAFQQRDLSKVGQFMTADSTCYDATKSVMLNGRQAVLDHFGAILAQHQPGEAWESSIEGMKVTVSGDLANATYQVRTSAGGMHAVAAVTHVFRHVDGRWLAIHLHRSWNVMPK